MKRSLTLISALGLLALTTSVLAETTPAPTTTTTTPPATTVPANVPPATPAKGLTKKPDPAERQKRLETAFTESDKDKDGKLTLQEYLDLENTRVERMKKQRREHLSKNPQFVKKHDTNGDGKIDEAEFEAVMMSKQPKKH